MVGQAIVTLGDRENKLLQAVIYLLRFVQNQNLFGKFQNPLHF